MNSATRENTVAVLAERIARTVDLLERQVCQCLGPDGRPATGRRVKVQCLRCEALTELGATPSTQP